MSPPGRINLVTSRTTADPVAIPVALHHLLSLRGLHYIVMLHYIAVATVALQLLLNNEHTSPLVREMANPCQALEDTGCSVSLVITLVRSSILPWVLHGRRKIEDYACSLCLVKRWTTEKRLIFAVSTIAWHAFCPVM